MALTAAEIANLKIARANFAATLATESANPRPTYTAGNQTFDFRGFFEYLTDKIAVLDGLIAQAEDGAWEVRSQGRP